MQIRYTYMRTRDGLNIYRKLRKKKKEKLTLNQKVSFYIIDGKGVILFNKIGFSIILIGIILSLIVPIIVPIIIYLLS